MATSAINFQGNLTLNTDLNMGEVEFSFRPPSNISGKLCYIDTKAFALSWDELYATPQSYHSYVLRSSWPQMQSASVETASSGVARAETSATGTLISTSATSTFTKTGCTTTGTSVTVLVPNTTNLYVGMTVTGTEIAANTTIVSIPGTGYITLSTGATASSAPTTSLTFGNGRDITVTSATGIVAGLAVTGTNIPSLTTVTGISGTTVTLSKSVTGATGTVTVYPNTITVVSAAGIKAGMIISGTVANNMIVTGVSGTTVTLSASIPGTITAGTSNNIAFIAPSTDFTQRVNSPLAMLNYGTMTSQSIPVLVRIPDGPQTVMFSVSRSDNNVIGLATSDISMQAMMSIVPADSRQPPIGV